MVNLTVNKGISGDFGTKDPKKSEKQTRNKRNILQQGGPLPVINRVIIPINGLINGSLPGLISPFSTES